MNTNPKKLIENSDFVTKVRGDIAMKVIAALCVSILSLSAGANESTVEARGESRVESHSTRSRFHLLTMNCHGEDAEGPESTPQSPPLNVDDPATPGCNRWEINVVADGDISKDQKEFELPLLDINYGIGDNLQLKYEVPYSNSQSGGSSTAQVGESKVGVKYAFFNDEAAELELAFYPQVALITPSDSEESKRLQTITTLPVLMTKKLGQVTQGDVSLTANLAYNLSKKPDTKDFIAASVGIGLPLTNRLSAMTEIATEQSFASDEEGNRAAVIKANLGVVTTLSKKFLVFASIGHSITSSDGADHEYGLIGFRVLAGGGTPYNPVIAAAHTQ